MVGRVVRFDEIRGYGFIRPREGGEDVFMHANDLLDEKFLYQAGSDVEFSMEQGDKGLKASEIRLIRKSSSSQPVERGTAAAAPASAPSLPTQYAADDTDEHVELHSVEEFRIDLTEALLNSDGSLTVNQLKEVRSCVIDLVRKRGWVVD
ncbi:cold-shock protein [Streptomyces sp. NPDC050759]|uniref:cold-shock protein n=1 Tax=Streptomyces sp. NPDC050759 TaxID=3365635 RepID=UPI0037AA44E6